MRARALFYGTPEVSVPSLRALAEVSEVVLVVCQPDRPQGRGLAMKAPAVKLAAEALGIEVYQPEKVRDGALLALTSRAKADLAVVIAYGRILPVEVLGAPRLGSLNLHASLLPALRGAAPIQRALMLGHDETGVCLMQMDAGLDTGPVLATYKLPISDEDDNARLTTKIGELAADVVRREIPRYLLGELNPVPQDASRATYAAPITRADVHLDTERSAHALHNQVRGLAPRPGAEVTVVREGHPDRRLKILATRVVEGQNVIPGAVSIREGLPLIETADGALAVLIGQAEGKKQTAGADLVHGRVLMEGDRVS
jgi:methionyl-tRNA formyltransferase